LPLVIILLILVGIDAVAQCGTRHPRDPLIIADDARISTQYKLNKTLSVNIYIVADAFEVWDYQVADFQESWDDLNELFEPIDLRFQICSSTNIPNYNWNSLSREEDPETGLNEEDEMLAQFYVPNTINVYYVEEITDEPGVDGYAYFPGGPDVIVLRKAHGPMTLPHEMGHFFALYHTFETEFGLELCDGSNCADAGDLICDTPADNNGNTDGCQYAQIATDPNGDLYTPYLSNIMSYYVDCVCRFTPQQYDRMAWFYLNERNYLW
jgi:hypothetical protein